MKKNRIFLGLIFIATACLLIADSMNLIGDIHIFSLFISFILIYWLFKSIIYKSVGGVIFSLTFLAIQYEEFLGIQQIGTWTLLLAAALLTIGINFIYTPKKHYENKYSYESEYTTGSQMNFNTSFSSTIKYIESDNFQRADIKCRFGDMKLYMDRAYIKEDSASLHIDVSFGGLQLYIPKEWRVVNHVDCSFSGVEMKNFSQSTGVPTLHLYGNAKFAGIEIIFI